MDNIGKYWNYGKDDYSARPSILFQDEHLNYLDDCKKIIDLGCGTGYLVKKLNEKIIYTFQEDIETTCWGITYNPIEVSNKLHNNVLFGNMQDIPFRDNTFDGFIMWDSLEHCESAFIALCEAKRVLVEKGKGLIFMPGENWLDCHCHICCYTVNQMIQLFKQAGLKLIKIHEKQYPDDNKFSQEKCDGMAIYEVEKDNAYKEVFYR